jgi:hypothetical protein
MFDDTHTKLGAACLVIIFLQTASGFSRPPKDRGVLRIIWQYFHLYAQFALYLSLSTFVDIVVILESSRSSDVILFA